MNLIKGDIKKHMLRIAIPASIGFFFNTMYNVVDTFYAGQISTEALAALSISFPIFFIIIAFGSGISQGATALISNALGEGNKKKARSYIHQGIAFAIIFGIILTIFGLIVTPYAFKLLGSEGEYLGMALDYMNTIVLGSVFFLLVQMGISPMLAKGDTKIFRNMLIAGFFLNLILDPWFMFGGFGVPAMGIRGIALATVFIQFLGCIYAFYHLTKYELWEKLNPKSLIPKFAVFKEIASQGIPASLNMATIALGIFIITFFVSSFGNDAVAAFGIATRIEQIAILPAIGLNMALTSLVGQNNGAKKMKRIKQARYAAIKFGFFVSLIGGVFAFVFAESLMRIFSGNPEVIKIGVLYLRIISPTFFGYILFSQNAAMLRGMKKPFTALEISLTRQVVFPTIILAIVHFILDYGIMGIWWGLFLNVWLVAILSFVIGSMILKKRETAILDEK
ncbi:MAG: MATE family efflux transporter [Nanoarchaeota archaeon]